MSIEEVERIIGETQDAVEYQRVRTCARAVVGDTARRTRWRVRGSQTRLRGRLGVKSQFPTEEVALLPSPGSAVLALARVPRTSRGAASAALLFIGKCLSSLSSK